MDPDVHVDVQYRDAIFKKLKQVPENQFCFDCNLKNPSWCSVILGIFICYNCATPHRHMGTHLSFVRSSELDMWTLRQLCYLEQAGNKVAKSFFRSHGVSSSVDYSSQIAERWRNDLSDKVHEQYPRKTENSAQSIEIQNKKPETSEKVEKIESVPVKVEQEKIMPKVIQGSVNKPAYKVPVGEAKHKFRKTKVQEPASVSFKPVSFKPLTEEEEFFDPQPLKAPGKVNNESIPVPTPAPAVVQRKPAEKKAISSEDYEAQFVDPKIQKARISQFAGANSISSDMYFGREEDKDIDLTGERLKDEVSRLSSLAINKASQVISIQLKVSLSGALSTLQSRFNSYN